VNQPSLFGADDDADRLDVIEVYSDGASRHNPGHAAIGAVVKDPSTDPPKTLATVSEYIGTETNNVAEYRALIAGLEAALPFAARRLCVRADSKLVVEQMRGAWKVKDANLRLLHTRARELLLAYDEAEFEWIPREENTEADLLANAALDAELG
jgi:ribonuclease HI